MSRIRTIKPDFWEDEKVGQLPIPCRLFFIGCWNFADDFGVIKGNAALLKSQIFPYDENLRVSEIKKWIDALVNARMLIPIIHAEESYYIIRTFRSHQVLDNRYSKSYISKDKSLVSKIVDTALNNNNVNTSSSQCVHNVITTEEMEMEKEEKENTSNEVLKKASLPSVTTKKEIHTDYSALANYFNDLLSPWLPKVNKIDGARRKAVDARIKEHGKDKVVEVLHIVAKSDFLTGRKEGIDWKCNFDWIFKKQNFEKILEGNYKNGESTHTSSGAVHSQPRPIQDHFSNYLRENFGFNGTAEEFEEWFNQNPYGG